MEMYPLKFKPIYKQRIWGGQKLREVFGKNLPPGQKIGESWELVDLPNDKSIIANGELTGKTLNQAIKQYPKEITGDENFSLPFPLLIKLLDAQDVLSVQVHPDIQTCQRMGKGEPKTECWYIISAEPGAAIYKGLKTGVTKEQFADAIKTGNVDELVEKIQVQQGQCHFLPAGTIHAIGAGLLIAEIQMASDTTYRVFDFNRVDNNGNPRQLHIQEAMESIHFDPSGDDLSVRTTGRLVDCEQFNVDKAERASILSGKMKILITLTGSGKIQKQDCPPTKFKAGDTLLIPAAYEGKMDLDDQTQYLTVTI
ncbi:type I phosphomannose isomerase catalytic subunit [Planctomycetota bacterium]